MIAPLLGACIGLTLALTGAGGGILAVPALVFGLHLSVEEAGPIGLLAVGLTAGLGALIGLRRGRVRYRAAAVIGGAGMLAAPLGVALARTLPAAETTLAFATVLLFVAARTYRRSRPRPPAAVPASTPPCVRSASSGRFIWTAPCVKCLAATGIGAGLLSGLLGVGGGFVIVPALSRYSDLATAAVVDTSLAVIALVSMSGVAAAATRGNVDWALALRFSAGAMGALLLGQSLSRRWSGAVLQRCFAVLCATVAVLLFQRGLQAI